MTVTPTNPSARVMSSYETQVDLRKLLSGAQLPALPQSAIRLLELSQNPDNGPAEFAAPIESDPGLTGQVLRFLNSSYFGFVQEISSVKLGIALVGIRTIKNFALWSAVFSLMPNPKCGPFDLKRLWQDSLRRAMFARRFGKLLGLTDSEDLFTAALLQDMAIPLLAKEMPRDYQELLDGRAGGTVRLSNLEQDRFGWTHSEAGGIMARAWKLPDSFAELVEVHARSELLVQGTMHPREAAVCLSALLPSTCDEQWREREVFSDAYHALVPASSPPLPEVFEFVDREFADFAPILKLAVPARPLVERLRETPQLDAQS
jgi:HD-like signal output (HDOD) protein